MVDPEKAKKRKEANKLRMREWRKKHPQPKKKKAPKAPMPRKKRSKAAYWDPNYIRRTDEIRSPWDRNIFWSKVNARDQAASSSFWELLERTPGHPDPMHVVKYFSVCKVWGPRKRGEKNAAE